MPQPAARQNDPVTGTDIHILLVPSPGGPVPTPTPLPFAGQLMLSLSTDVLINGLPAATQGSIAQNMPPHIPPSPFSKPPTNQGRVIIGSPTVLVNGKPLARMGDQVATCNDPVDAPTSVISAGSPDVLVA
ncbi:MULTISPECIES: PAAR domain-containing protein [Paractinoplanes]|uniref:PAAR motif protein n=2 Tax=Paractinoplanes TaxID=3240234 RepID=A0A919NVH7_9ACTN|nr:MULTISPECIES: PAAR domain-containing protein [Actinoplanes]GIE00857.1 PAAR motif protein [Actinoplanes durhamensis]GIF25945.1 PAAR motif protein [Actinoplanes tereljensis]